MDGLTASQAFQARELSRDGIWSGRIAELLGVDERWVLAALAGAATGTREREQPPVDQRWGLATDTDTDTDTGTDAADDADIRRDPDRDPSAWPPPADERTEWDQVVIRAGYGVAPERVRVRWVLLWGKRVQINDGNEVWCPDCRRFRTTAELGHPWNGCRVGLPARPNGVVHVPDTTVEDQPHGSRPNGNHTGYVDLLRTPL